ncbi:hypothetical protein LTR53_008434 [Teratosphaeriaceae sp. CCFEE 6253]|nr:hypothetical protein LTR53_008434 [Teratosphaeriaceae sp. CCFEE 6253]
MDAFTPQQTIELVSRIGTKKAHMRLDKLFWNSLDRRISVLDLAKNWVISFFGNLAGTLFFMAIIMGYGGVFEETEVFRHAAISLAIQKAQQPQWHQIFLRGIGANWLVCFAVFISISSREVVSKIIAIWFPTATFVALALDHVVANMFGA